MSKYFKLQLSFVQMEPSMKIKELNERSSHVDTLHQKKSFEVTYFSGRSPLKWKVLGRIS